MNKITSEIVNAIIKVTGHNPTGLHEPEFSGNEMRYLRDCIDTTFVSSIGKYVEVFEKSIAEFTGSKYAIAVVNGTSALHIAVKLAGVKQGEEVLVPALTFVATANAVTYVGATPHFVEIESVSMGIDPEKLREYLLKICVIRNNKTINKETNKHITALIVMHTFGHPSRIKELKLIADEFNLKLIEDAAESLGSFFENQHTGTFGELGILSFNGNKIITTGGGGAILTNNNELAYAAKKLTSTSKIPHIWEYDHDQIAYNYRMPNLNAALGFAQLEQLEKKLVVKRLLANKYKMSFSDVKNAKIVAEPPGATSNYWLNNLRLNCPSKNQRDEILEISNKMGIQTRPFWNMLPNLKIYADSPRMDLSEAENLSNSIISIPSSTKLIRDEDYEN